MFTLKKPSNGDEFATIGSIRNVRFKDRFRSAGNDSSGRYSAKRYMCWNACVQLPRAAKVLEAVQ